MSIKIYYKNYTKSILKYITKESLKTEEKNTEIAGFGEHIICFISKSTGGFSLS